MRLIDALRKDNVAYLLSSPGHFIECSKLTNGDIELFYWNLELDTWSPNGPVLTCAYRELPKWLRATSQWVTNCKEFWTPVWRF